jgi:molybdopterin converting factor small subunit
MDMAQDPHQVSTTVRVRVELFGMARLGSGRALLDLDLPGDATLTQVAQALVAACPALRGLAVRADGTGLLESYRLNLNGRVFVTEAGVPLRPGDTLLLFSSQAGG